MHKSGFVNIIGNPNVGKSTLMNTLVGEKLSIITSKAQTTRHRILGIVNGDDFQIVYSDTPGIIKPVYKLQETMMGHVGEAMTDADIILYVTDVYEKIDKNVEYLTKLSDIAIPVIVVVNKIDLVLVEHIEKVKENIKVFLPKAHVIEVSALNKFNTEKLLELILSMLPENPPYYDKEDLTDKPERFFVSEIIREKILLNYNKEVPYSVEVIVETFKETPKIINIQTVIYVARDSQKGILLGKDGRAMKKMATESRLDLEKFFGKKVFLEIFIKVLKDWKNDSNKLKRLGYLQ